MYLAFIIATYLILLGNLIESKVEDSGLCLKLKSVGKYKDTIISNIENV